jgi:hypothetical protein
MRVPLYEFFVHLDKFVSFSLLYRVEKSAKNSENILGVIVICIPLVE